MGHTSVKVRVHKPDLSTFKEIELLVDTGSTYSWIPEEILKELKIESKREREFKTIDGRIVRRPIGEAPIECMDERATTVVVFAEEGDGKVLGVHALEGLGLEVDPSSGRLRRIEAVLAF